MSDLATLKSDIATSLGTSRYTAEIATEINRAITHFQKIPFEFSTIRTATFATVLNQVWYSPSDDADIGYIQKIDSLIIEESGVSDYTLRRVHPSTIEIWDSGSSTAGKPVNYTILGKQVGLGPKPDGVYTVRVHGVMAVQAPASDGEADNPWMIEGAEMIKQRVIWKIAADRMRDTARSSVAYSLMQEAVGNLRLELSRRGQTGRIQGYYL